MKEICEKFLKDLKVELSKLSLEEIAKLEQEIKGFLSKIQQEYNVEKMKKMNKR